MDFYNDNELDYEEDELEENAQEKDCEKGDINENSNMSGSDDEYLQIDFSEEEENLTSDDTLQETAAEEKQCIGIVNEQNEIDNHQGNSLEQSALPNNFREKNSGEYNSVTVLKVKKKKYFRPCKHQTQLQGNSTKALSVLGKNLCKKTRLDQEGHSNEFRKTKRRRGCKQRACCNRMDNRFGASRNFNLFGSLFRVESRNRSKNESRFLNRQYDFLQEDEKKLVELKKEARLKRFMHDGIVRNGGKSDESAFEKTSPSDSQLGVPHSQKTEEGNLLIGNFCDIKRKIIKNSENVQDLLPNEKPMINKELLLKKRNPFDVSNLSIVTQVKQENEDKPEEKSSLGGKFLGNFRNFQLMKKKEPSALKTPNLTCQGFYIRKNNTDSCVKFIRTVTKKFDEYAVRSGYPSPLSYSLETSPRENVESCPSRKELVNRHDCKRNMVLKNFNF